MLSGINFHPIFLIVVGLLLALFGYKIQKIALTLMCFLLGYTLANLVTPNFLDDNLIIIIINSVVGILVSGIGIKLEKFAIGSSVAYLVYISLSSYAGIIPFEMTPIIEIAISLAAGIAATLLIKPVLILVTSIGGISMFLCGLATYVTIPSSIYLIVLLIVIALSTIIQFKTN